MRFIIALVALLTLSGCADIDKSLYSLSNTVAPQDRVTGQRTLNTASRQQQIQSSNSQTDRMLQEEYLNKGRPINQQVNAAMYQRLQRVFGRIHAVSHMAGEQWQAFLLPDNQWNAFTAGGSEIFVFKGLMDNLQSDDELAAVIGHEIAHVAANHVYERQSSLMAAKLAGSKSMTRHTYQAAYTINNEEEADSLGVLYATLAGYDPYAAARLWKRMYDNGGDFSAAIIDHPVNSHRYQAAQALAKSYTQYSVPGQINPNHAEILAAFRSQGPNVAAGQGGGVLSVLETAASVMGQKEAAKQEERAQRQTRKFTDYVTQSTQLLGRSIIADNTLQVAFKYNGTQPIINLNLMAQLGNETPSDHTPPGYIMQPGTQFYARFKFVSVDLRTVDINKIGLAVVHAEPK